MIQSPTLILKLVLFMNLGYHESQKYWYPRRRKNCLVDTSGCLYPDMLIDLKSFHSLIIKFEKSFNVGSKLGNTKSDCEVNQMTILYITCQCVLFLGPSLQVPDQADQYDE